MALVLLLSPTDVLNEFIKDMDLARDDTGWFFAIAYNPSFQLPQNRLWEHGGSVVAIIDDGYLLGLGPLE